MPNHDQDERERSYSGDIGIDQVLRLLDHPRRYLTCDLDLATCRLSDFSICELVEIPAGPRLMPVGFEFDKPVMGMLDMPARLDRVKIRLNLTNLREEDIHAAVDERRLVLGPFCSTWTLPRNSLTQLGLVTRYHRPNPMAVSDAD